MKQEEVYKEIISSLRLVASSSEVQLASLPSFVASADEIALIYNNSYLLVPQLVEKIPPTVITKMKELDDLFTKMSDDEELWNISSLKTNSLWENCRKLAKDILNDLGEEYSAPDLNFIHFVK